MNKFEKVSFEQFREGYLKCFPEADDEDDYIEYIYNHLILPNRATSGSAGYDFHSPFDFILDSGTSIMIPTGVRVKIDEGYFLGLFPRSSLGFKYRLQFDNTIPVVDCDYYGADNEGHIFAKLTNDSKIEKTLRVNMGESFMQGIFIPFGITDDDDATGIRNGGFGSTNS